MNFEMLVNEMELSSSADIFSKISEHKAWIVHSSISVKKGETPASSGKRLSRDEQNE